jgi:hypothetical protein
VVELTTEGRVTGAEPLEAAVTNPFPFTVTEAFVKLPTLLFTVASVSAPVLAKVASPERLTAVAKLLALPTYILELARVEGRSPLFVGIGSQSSPPTFISK